MRHAGGTARTGWRTAAKAKRVAAFNAIILSLEVLRVSTKFNNESIWRYWSVLEFPVYLLVCARIMWKNPIYSIHVMF